MRAFRAPDIQWASRVLISQLLLLILLVAFFNGTVSVGYVNMAAICLNKERGASEDVLSTAEEFLYQSIEWTSPNALARRKLATVYFMKSAWVDAASHFEKALEIVPYDVLMHYDLANVYMKEGRRSDARHHWHLARAWKRLREDSTEQGLAYLSKKMFTEAEKEFRDLIGAAGKLNDAYWMAQGYQWLGQSLERQWKVNDAIVAYEDAIGFGRQHWPACGAMVDLARLYAQSGEFGQTRELANRAVCCDPQNRYFLLVAGDLHQAYGDYPKAIAYYHLATYVPPFDGLPWQGVANCNLQQGKYEDALAAAKKGLEENDQLPVLYRALGKAYLKIGDKMMACEALQKAVALSPAETDSRHALADANCPSDQ